MSSRDRPKSVSPTPATVAQALPIKGRADGPSATARAKPSTKGKIQCRTTVQRTNEHKKWNEDGHSVFGDHRLKQFSRELRACTWTATMAII